MTRIYKFDVPPDVRQLRRSGQRARYAGRPLSPEEKAADRIYDRLRRARPGATEHATRTSRASRAHKRGYAPPDPAGPSLDHLKASQEGLCFICQNVLGPGYQTHLDHNHDTGEIRGALCCSCNGAIGLLGDDPDVIARAFLYLCQPPARQM